MSTPKAKRRKIQKPLDDKTRARQILEKYELDEVDKAILRYKLQYPTITDREMGELIGLDRGAVQARRAKEAWQNAYNDFQLPARELIRTKLEALTRKYLKLADCGDARVEERVIRACLLTHGVLKFAKDAEGEWDKIPLVLEMPMSRTQIVVGPEKIVKALEHKK